MTNPTYISAWSRVAERGRICVVTVEELEKEFGELTLADERFNSREDSLDEAISAANREIASIAEVLDRSRRNLERVNRVLRNAGYLKH